MPNTPIETTLSNPPKHHESTPNPALPGFPKELPSQLTTTPWEGVSIRRNVVGR
ncbi:Exportin-T [Sesbania bispinosa]|nr:Exportin-T [Sesbania bispinosa]